MLTCSVALRDKDQDMSEKILSKIPPHSRESEMMVLGCMLTNINSLNVSADLLDEYDFYFMEHRHIFSAMRSLYAADKPADVHLVAEELKRVDRLKSIGGVSYLTTLAQYAGTSAHIEHYSGLVRDKSLLRRMIQTAQEIEKEALNEPTDVAASLDEAQQKLFRISQTANSPAGIHVKDILSGVKAQSLTPYLKEIEARQEEYQKRDGDTPKITGVPTHFLDLDKLINGLNGSNLIILAGRPAMGKTIIAMNIAENVALKNNLAVGIFSLEMTADQLVHRLVSSHAEVESEKITSGSLNGLEYQRIVAGVKEIQQHPIIIDDQPGLKITDLRARARRMKEAYDIRLLIVDYLQLLSGSNHMRNPESRQNEISEISRLLKNLARELNIPVICLSQLSRRVEERTGHRPMMSDLRESGCLTGDTLIQDAVTGQSYTLRELAERAEQDPLPVYAVDENLNIGIHSMVKVFYSGRKTVYRLTTASGRTLRASSNHPFRSREGWKPLEELILQEEIAVPELAYCPTSQKSFPETLQQSAILWDEIVSLEKEGVEDVFDATVPGVHNFVAGDIIVHNSIEQDADIVVFILRREYYDPMDKPGMAELIVAKNRHGSIGNVNLTFRKEFVKFTNYAFEEGSKYAAKTGYYAED